MSVETNAAEDPESEAYIDMSDKGASSAGARPCR
jgi:hypothetical protein